MNMRIDTRRFLLRDFSEADRRQFIDYQMDPRYRRLYDFSESDEDRAGALFDRFGAWRHEIPRQNFQIGIFECSSSRLCGCAGLRHEGKPKGVAALGLELAPDYWGRYGVAVEAASALINHGFGTLGLDSIIGDTASGNRRVEALARWFGATIVECRDGPDWMKARGWNEVGWALSQDAWMASPARRRFLKS